MNLITFLRHNGGRKTENKRNNQHNMKLHNLYNFGKLKTPLPATPRSHDIQHVSTVSWQQHSDDDDLEQNYYGPPAPDGWQIVQSSVKFIVEHQEGDEGSAWTQNLISYNPVGFHVRTEHHRFGTSGKVDFHFEYDLQKS